METLRYGPDVQLPEERSHFQLVSHNYPTCRPPSNEDYAEGLERIKHAKSRIDHVTQSEDYDSLLVVGHGNYLPRLCELLVGIEPLGRFSYDNVGLTKLSHRLDYELDFEIKYSNRNPLEIQL